MLRLLRCGICNLLQLGGPDFAEVGEEDDEEDFHAMVVSGINRPKNPGSQKHTVLSSSSIGLGRVSLS